MANKEIIINGTELDQMGESSYDLDQPNNGGNYDARVSELNRKTESLEREKLQMVNLNLESKERIKKLSLEIGELRNDNASKKEKLKEMEKEIEWSKEELKTLESVAKRAVELKIEVSRMQHDFVDEQR
ncbi:peroxisomal and mitochondrial division factor 2-like [Quercus lobata]|uniref:peroxisomal and mitochondrial division factor 2-like n=1 Tax=Quercus lobata TaxID=97700 RepID=UPI0012485AC5|nr:peroxisomal and mitochondrial division factor 2-like [Quercus lobata]